jgi:hypothetical protein
MAAKVFNKNGYKVPGQPDLSYKAVVNDEKIIGWTNNGGKTMIQAQQYR